jgi:hypothetical protein
MLRTDIPKSSSFLLNFWIDGEATYEPATQGYAISIAICDNIDVTCVLRSQHGYWRL